jgi:putative thioredoxin
MNSNIFDLTAQNVQQDLIDASKEKLIIIDFWADWCEPCKQLMPVLEKLATEYSEQVILAKVNCDAEQQLAMQFGIKSLPTVMLFKDGQPIDGFAGVQPEAAIREILDKHLPSKFQLLMADAFELHQQQSFEAAYPIIKQALTLEATNADAKLLLADICIEIGQLDEASQIVSTIKMADQNGQYQHVLAKLEMAKKSAESPEIVSLQKQLSEDPESLSLKRELAIALHQAKRHEESLSLLLEVLKKDLAFEDVRQVYLDIIAGLPDGNELAGKFRRSLYNLLY